MTTTYDVGDAAFLTTSVYDTAGNPTTATVVLTVTKPDGTILTPGVTFTAPNVYSASVVLDQLRTWFYTWTVSGAVTAVDSGQFTAANPAPPYYASLADLKARMQITDTGRDRELTAALEAGARDIDRDTGRRFYLDRIPTARVFNPRNRQYQTAEGMKFLIDDVGDPTSLLVEVGTTVGGTWSTVAANSYEIGPDNAIVRGDPVTWLLRTYLPWIFYPLQRLRVTTVWGWPAIPAQIQQANLLRSARLFKRRESPDGVAGAGDFGVVRVGRYDPDYDGLIEPFIIPAFG